MNTSDFKDYKVDHLFLLIGENPLPNYVAARLLLNEQGGTPYLVHTTDTEEQAKRLAKILCEERHGFNTAQLVSLQDYESDAYHIQDEICRKINSLKNGRLGLNYTGGTKAMAVHAHRALFSQDRPDTVFSYLDSRRLEMCIDQENDERIHKKVSLNLSLEDVFRLHVPSLKHPPTIKPILPEVVKVLAGATKEWSMWVSSVLLPAAKKKKSSGELGKWESKTKLSNLSLSLEGLPQKIIDGLRVQNFIKDDGLLSLQNFQRIGQFKEVVDVCEWLAGKWLEHYVLEQIKAIKETSKEQFFQKYGINLSVPNVSDNSDYLEVIHDYGMSFNVPIVSGSSDDFEFDVAFMRSYQLFAISCTTDAKKSLCKEKLFEAYLRADQLGGSEARVALVCCFDEPNKLKAELEVAIKDRKVAVFGREDIPNLSKGIVQWIADSERETR